MNNFVRSEEERLESRIWMDQFRLRSLKERIPLTGMLELTSRCNLRCVHCYLGPQEVAHAKRESELSTAAVKDLIDQFADAGCLYFAITGGDPMMRKDFAEIYLHAKQRGLMLTILCDGVLVTEKIAELFRDYPPRQVEISLYGATEETYERVTRVKGSHAKCLRGIDRLLEAGVKVEIKTVLMTLNEHELDAMRKLAEDRGCGFRFDSAIFPCLPDSSKEPMKLRVDAKTAVAKEFDDPTLRDSWLSYWEKRKNLPESKTLYRCGAGVTGFYADPFGAISPCLMTTQYRYPVGEKSFKERWDEDLHELRSKTAQRDDYECTSCEKRSMCSGCPAFNFLETGHEDQKSQYKCDQTHARWELVFGADGPDASRGSEALRATTSGPSSTAHPVSDATHHTHPRLKIIN